jgi:hypothetical protein
VSLTASEGHKAAILVLLTRKFIGDEGSNNKIFVLSFVNIEPGALTGGHAHTRIYR